MDMTFYSDSGHGWLEVPIKEVKRLKVRVSPYSYKRGSLAYLEEDVDAPAFLSALKKSGEIANINEVSIDGDAAIRSYDPYFR